MKILSIVCGNAGLPCPVLTGIVVEALMHICRKTCIKFGDNGKNPPVEEIISFGYFRAIVLLYLRGDHFSIKPFKVETLKKHKF